MQQTTDYIRKHINAGSIPRGLAALLRTDSIEYRNRVKGTRRERFGHSPDFWATNKYFSALDCWPKRTQVAPTGQTWAAWFSAKFGEPLQTYIERTQVGQAPIRRARRW